MGMDGGGQKCMGGEKYKKGRSIIQKCRNVSFFFFLKIAWEVCDGSGKCWNLVGSLTQWSALLIACCYQASSHYDRRPKLQPGRLLQHFSSTSKLPQSSELFLMHGSPPGGYSGNPTSVDKRCRNSSYQCSLWQEDHGFNRWRFLDNAQHPHWGDH